MIAHVAPWELERQPLKWQTRILMAEAVEAEYREWYDKKHNRNPSRDRIARVKAGQGRFQGGR